MEAALIAYVLFVCIVCCSVMVIIKYNEYKYWKNIKEQLVKGNNNELQ